LSQGEEGAPLDAVFRLRSFWNRRIAALQKFA
jgi:hypothetical protein